MFCLAPNPTQLFHFTSLLSNSLPLPNLFNAHETYLMLNRLHFSIFIPGPGVRHRAAEDHQGDCGLKDRAVNVSRNF